MDGFAVCREVREFSQAPIIMVTGVQDTETKVRVLESGADDYVTKPFAPSELTSRVNAVLRRARTDGLGDEFSESLITVGSLRVDFSRNKVFIGDEGVRLSGTEFRLLSYLVRNHGRVLTPDQILERVWGPEYVGEGNLLRVVVRRLRIKLHDDADRPQFIITHPGIGYECVRPAL